MGESGSGARRRAIGAEAKAAFLAALRAGAGVESAAKAAGFSIDGFYSARRRDAAFRLGWEMARELDAARVAAKRRPPARKGAARVAPGNRRRLQARKLEHVKFTAERRALFLACFAATADTTRAAREAGVAVSTVTKTRRNDPDFAAAYDASLAQAYVGLEVEAVRQRLAAQEAMKAAEVPSTIEMAEEFDRVMKLLQRWDRRGGGAGRGEIPRERMKSSSFDEAMAVLAKRLKALDYKPTLPPPEQP
jgi:hypothetical protein